MTAQNTAKKAAPRKAPTEVHKIEVKGVELEQRPIALDLDEPAPAALNPGARVRVYHKRRTTMHLTDCKLGPNAEGDILVSDFKMPNVAKYVVRTAEG